MLRRSGLSDRIKCRGFSTRERGDRIASRISRRKSRFPPSPENTKRRRLPNTHGPEVVLGTSALIELLAASRSLYAAFSLAIFSSTVSRSSKTARISDSRPSRRHCRK